MAGEWNHSTLQKAARQAAIRHHADKFYTDAVAFGKAVGRRPVSKADSDAKVQIRIAENKNSQCALAFMIKRRKKLGAMANLKTTSRKPGVAGAYPTQFKSVGAAGDLKKAGLESRWKARGKGYQNFKYLNGSNPAALLNTLVRVPEAMSFFNLASSDLSKLNPYAKFYLLDKNNTATELPFSTRAFGGKEDSSLINMLNSTGVNSLDVGLQEVSFDLLATNPAELNNTIECKIKIYLNNLSGLLSKRKSPTGRTFYWKDLIERKGKKGEENNVKDNKVRLVMGWTLPSQSDHTTYKMAKDTKIVQSLAMSRYSLLMYLRDHTLDIKTDGSATLSITYNAYAEGALNHPSTNILGINAAEHKQVQILKKRVTRLRKEREKQEREDKRNGVAPTTRKPDPERSTTGEATGVFGLGTDPNAEERARAKLKKAKDNVRNSAYVQLMNQLYHRGSIKLIHVPVEFLGRIGVVGAGFVGTEDSEGDNEDKIYQHTAQSTLQLMCSDHIKRKLGDIIDRTQRYGGVGGTYVAGGTSAGSGDNSERSYNQAISRMRKIAQQKKGERTKAAAKFLGKGDFMKATILRPSDEKGKKYAKKMRQDFGLGGDIASIPFTYMGDILEAALGMLYRKDSAWSQFFVSSLTARTRKEALNKMAVDKGIWPTIMTGPVILEGGCVGDKPRIINIGDVPVTIQSLTTFLINNLVRPQRATWRLRDFLWALMSELLPTALGYQCMDQPPGGSIMPRMEVFHLPSHGGNPLRSTSFHVNADKFQKMKNKIDYQGDGKTVTQYDALILFATYFNPVGLKGSEKQDVSKGIYHLRPGVDGGPIKSYSFSRNDQPFLAEAKVFGSSDIGQTDDISGGAVYNITMKMVGNGFFSPGQMVYINLESIGVGKGVSSDSLSYKMNIGGYYLITKVSGLFSPTEGFITTVEAMWQQTGVTTGPNVAAQQKTHAAIKAKLQEWGFVDPKIDPSMGTITATDPKTGNKIVAPLGELPTYDEHSRWNARDGSGTTRLFSNPALAEPYADIARKAAEQKKKKAAEAAAKRAAATAAGYRAGEGTTFN